MLSHDNITWISHAHPTYINIRDGKETFLSYLPLSHIAAQVAVFNLKLHATKKRSNVSVIAFLVLF